jgi:anti-sigma factor RsiW
MMQKPSDETLIAYLDGELDTETRGEVESWLEADAELRDTVAALAASAEALRAAFEPVLHEPVPERLLAAARGVPAAGLTEAGLAETGAEIVDFKTVQKARAPRSLMQRPWARFAMAAGVGGLLIGGGVGYFAGTGYDNTTRTAATNAAASNWLDNIAGYHKMLISAGGNDQALVDVPPDPNDPTRKIVQKLPSDFKLPNLKPWGLDFQGARYLVVGGQPATQLFYTTDNKKLGPLTVVIGATNQPDIAPTFDRRGDLNMLYWRHHGHAYALVGTADIGYLWNISNDIEYQLDAI